MPRDEYPPFRATRSCQLRPPHTAVRLKPTSSPANILIAALLPSLEDHQRKGSPFRRRAATSCRATALLEIIQQRAPAGSGMHGHRPAQRGDNALIELRLRHRVVLPFGEHRIITTSVSTTKPNT